MDEYAAMLPSLETLVHEYGLEPGAAFHVYRPILRRLKPRPAPAKDDPTKDRDAAVALDVGGKEVSWGELLRVVRGMLPDEVWGAISPELYLTFWSLSLYDLHVPTARYDAEIDRRRKEIEVLEGPHQNQRGGDGNGSGAGAEATRRRKERERLAALVDSLERERDAQEREVAAVSKRLAREKDRFLADLPRRNETAAAIAQHCVLPRCVFSHADAVYCARFVERLNALDTPWFSTVTYFNQIFWISSSWCSAAPNTTGRLGKFMRENFALLHSWKADEATYEKECHAVCGFNLKLNDPGAGKVSYAEYVKLVYKWHVRSCKFYLACLEDKEYMSIRNVLAVLSKLVEFYPAIARTGNLMMREAARIKEKDERGDLQTVANRYLAMLQREKAKWRADNVFNPYLPPDPKEIAAREVKPKADGEREKAAEKGEGGGGGARRGGRGGKDAAKLSASAQEFTPTKSNAKDESGGGGGKRGGGGGGGGGGGRVGKDDTEPEKVREREPDRSRDRDRVARGGDRDRPRRREGGWRRRRRRRARSRRG